MEAEEGLEAVFGMEVEEVEGREGEEETLYRALAKLVMRAAGEQAKTSCSNL